MYILIKDGLNFIENNISDNDLPFVYRGIEIDLKKDDYYISLKNGYFFSDRDKVRKLDNKKYVIKNNDIFNDIELYIYKDNKGINEYYLYENKPFVFLASKEANIINRDKNIKNIYLTYKEAKLTSNADCLLVNGKKYDNQILKDNDEIRLYNFKFIYYDDYLYINNFLTDIKIKKKIINENIIKYQNTKREVNNYYLEPLKKLEIETIKEFEEPKIIEQKKLIYQLGPSLTMTLATLAIASINIYNNYLNEAPILNSIIYIIMPVSMIFTGVLWPLLSSFHDKRKNKKLIKKNKDEYIDYLNNYRNDVANSISKYVSDANEYYFDGKINKDKLFYITNKSEEFLKLSLGHTSLNYDFIYKEVADDEISEKLGSIKYLLNDVKDMPCFVDVLNYKTISIVSKKNLRSYLIKKLLLEFSSKYHYDDFYIAIYSDKLSDYSPFYSLPQLICSNNRLTLNTTRDLQELNNKNIDKPMILFTDKKINIDITSKQIHLLYFCLNDNEIYKDTDLLIKYEEDKGTIYKEDKIDFTYDTNDIPFKEYTDILGDYQKINYLKKVSTFKDVFDSYNILSFYNLPQRGLQADFAYTNNELMSFDLHENKNGPHGLIGGATGSGKSELIISMLLSLCIRYRPDYLNMIVVDYKGGGIVESLSYKGKRLPHIIASVDNLQNDIFERLIVAINFECKRRQLLFKELSNKSLTNIANLDDYLENNKEEFNLPKIAHLLIVVDEFAELKKENPTVIKELISFSRIGRSLGIHLIFATQRPSGIIDDEIWSNSKFKLALKVFNEKDSNDIIKTNEAAYLNNPGEFLLNIDGNITKGQSVYSKTNINNDNPFEVSLLDTKLNIVAKRVLKQDNSIKENGYIVKKIIDESNKHNIKTNNLDFLKPLNKDLNILKEIYKVSNDYYILGEKDDYLNANKEILNVRKDENILLYSTRNNEINTFINQLDNKTIVIGLNKHKNKYICDSLKYDEIDDINYLFNKLIDNKDRMTLLIEDLSCLLSYDDDLNNKIYKLLRRSVANNLNIIAISKQSSLNFKLINSFKNKYVIGINEKQDLINIFSCNSIYSGDSYYMDDKLISFVPVLPSNIQEETSNYHSFLDIIPKEIKYYKDNNSTLLGYDVVNREKVYLNNNESLLISSFDNELINKYKYMFRNNENVDIKVYDKSLINNDYSKYLWIGDGIYNQRLFYFDSKFEIDKYHGYLYKGNKGNILRVVNYE